MSERRSSNCRLAACAAVALVIVLDFLSAYPTIERLTNSESDEGSQPSAASNHGGLRYPEISIPVDTSYLDDISESKIFQIDTGEDGQKVHIFHSPENTRMTVNFVGDESMSAGNMMAFSGIERISRDISENKQMRQQQLASIKRDRANLFSAMPSTNEQQFITEDNQLVIHNVGDGSQSPSKIKITVQELPPLGMLAKLIATRSKQLDHERSSGGGNPKISKVMQRLEDRLADILPKSDESTTEQKRSKERVTLSVLKSALNRLFGPTDASSTDCFSGRQSYNDTEDLEIFFTLYKPRSERQNPMMFHLSKFEAIPFEVVHFTVEDKYGINITDSSFDLGERKTLIYTHGFRGTPHGPTLLSILGDLIKGQPTDYNVIVSDYRKISASDKDYKEDYSKKFVNSFRRKRSTSNNNMASNLKAFGYSDVYAGRHPVPFELSQVLSEVAKQVSPSDVHMVGHSLGSHISGEAAYIFSQTNKNSAKIGRITGLDPPAVCFTNVHHRERLDRNDADFVDVIHASRLGSPKHPIGHKDYWVNGGQVQPRCQTECTGFFECLKTTSINAVMASMGYSLADPCSHAKVRYYFANSISTCRHRFKAIPVSVESMKQFLSSDEPWQNTFGEDAVRLTEDKSAAFNTLWNSYGQEEMGMYATSEEFPGQPVEATSPPHSNHVDEQDEMLPELDASGDGSGAFDENFFGEASFYEDTDFDNEPRDNTIYDFWTGSQNYIVPVSAEDDYCFE